LRLAQRQRISLDRIFAFLETSTGEKLPGYFRAAVARAYNQREGASLEEVWLLRVPDASLLQIPELQDLIVETVGPELAILREGDREHVSRILLENQVLMEIEEGRS
jgi:hypothetical protein